MTYEVLRPLKLKLRGGQIVQPGDRIEADPEKARTYLERGFLRPVADFEKLKWDLWREIAHCKWGLLTPEEQVRWETAVTIQPIAEREGNVAKWQEMAGILLEIVEAVKQRGK